MALVDHRIVVGVRGLACINVRAGELKKNKKMLSKYKKKSIFLGVPMTSRG